jgi:hypothetical protein
VPAAAELLAVKVSVLLLVVLDGLNEAVTPLGKPDADKATLPLKPLRSLTEIVLVAVPPWVTLTLPGESDNEKLPLLPLPPAKALISAGPFGLPQPVTKS